MTTRHLLPTGDQLMLQTYLNDHRAGAAAGLALCERLAASNEGTPLGATVSEICAEIAEDATSLDHVIEHLRLHQNPLKRTIALAGERVGRLKLNGQLTGYSPLSRLLEIESLLAGIDAKRSLWKSLLAVSPEGRVGDADLRQLIARADSQRERLLSHHDEAASQALAGLVEPA